MMERGLFFAVLLVLGGCAMPVEQVQTLDERPTVLVRGTTAGARMMVDGLDVGAVVGAHGLPQAIRITSGTHVVEVMDGGRTVIRERLFVSGGVLTTLIVPGTTTP